MKILYGVQATGNGHITRARVMATALAAEGVEVDFLFSGRDPEKLFNMEIFGNYRVHRGLTFHTENGKINRWRSVTDNNLIELMRDIRALELNEYDLIISDFEPVSAWAAKLQQKSCIGIAHQYALHYPLPGPGMGLLTKMIMRFLAPVQQKIGLHWHHFNQSILPPLTEPNIYPVSKRSGMILVYLPFESKNQIRDWLMPFQEFEFHVYSDVDRPQYDGHILWLPLSRQKFQEAQACCEGVIANCGFGLASEVLQLGKKLLTKPLAGQPEQLSNAAVLNELGLAEVFTELKEEQFYRWITQPDPEKVVYPDVAVELARWISGGRQLSAKELAQHLWCELKPKPN